MMHTRRFLHLADLHIGRKLGDYQLLPDQEKVLEQACEAAKDCEAVLIAGDVYDKPNPSAEAMKVFDDFLTKLCQMGKQVYLISGNHDSAGRISYLGRLLESSRVTVSAPFTGVLQAASQPEDEVQIWLMPFLTPNRVREFYPEEKINSYEDAVRVVLEHSPLNPEKINLLIAHQFITGGQTSEEEFAVGGLDNISAELFREFDYVALGHLHMPQSVGGRETVRYAGSPLKYSLSEEHQKKSFTILEIQGKQKIEIHKIPVQLPHDVRTVKGSFQQLSEMEFTQDYVHVTLTDENPVPDARMMLRSIFPRMCGFRLENARLRTDGSVMPEQMPRQQSPAEMFRLFYLHQNNNHEPSEAQMQIVRDIFAQLEREELQ